MGPMGNSAHFKPRIKTLSRCQVQQFSDTMECRICGLRWDTNEMHPPPCPFDALPNPRFVRAAQNGVATFFAVIGLLICLLTFLVVMFWRGF